MMPLLHVIKLLRPKHWIKNGFIFLPLFFSGNITDTEKIINAIIAFVAFCLLASSIYIINDWKDREKDRLHPTKRFRPLASGKIKANHALALSALLLLTAFLIIQNYLWDPITVALFAIYLVQNLLYTFKLKDIAIVDITIISTGFVLRILIGGVVTDTPLSQWIILMTFLLSLFLALAKRRDDLLLYERTDQSMRKSLGNYNLAFVDSSMSITAAITVVSYIMYTQSPEVIARLGNHIYLTSIFVILGILQYLKLTQVGELSSSPVRLLFKSILLQLIIGAWILSFVLLLYFNVNLGF